MIEMRTIKAQKEEKNHNQKEKQDQKDSRSKSGREKIGHERVRGNMSGRDGERKGWREEGFNPAWIMVQTAAGEQEEIRR